METMAASSFPITPQTQQQTSHIRSSSHLSSSKAANNPANTTTRSMLQQGDTQQQQPPLSAPASQESFVSAHSTGSSILAPDSSNVSQLTAYTDLASPTSSSSFVPERAFEQQYAAAASRPSVARVRTPEGSGDVLHAFASPMSLTSPVSSTNGTKRTASGHVKNAPSLPSTPLTATFAGHRSRADSISSTSSRAGELAASLKARLGYAMAKVELGLEHKNINEIEQLAVRKMSSSSPNRRSMSHLDYSSSRPLSSGLTNGTARLSVYEGHINNNLPALDGTTSPPPSKRHSGIYSPFPPASSSSQPSLNTTAPRLQPAPDIRPATHRHHHHYYTAPSSQTQTTAMSPPRTPVNDHHLHRRPPTIRTDTQTAEAERDALQALFQLGSPHASQVSWRQNNNNNANASQANSSQASPLRSEFTTTTMTTPRKVTFARSDSESERSSSEGSLAGAAAMAGRA